MNTHAEPLSTTTPFGEDEVNSVSRRLFQFVLTQPQALQLIVSTRSDTICINIFCCNCRVWRSLHMV